MPKKQTTSSKLKPVFQIYVAGERSSYIVQNLKEEVFHGIPCVACKYAKPTVEWLYGIVIRIPRDKITMITEFKSIHDYLKRLKTVDME